MFTVDTKSAKTMARTIERYFKRRGIELKLGQAMDLLAILQGLESGQALLAALKDGIAEESMSDEVLALLREALHYEQSAFDHDAPVSGTELVDFFASWRKRLKLALEIRGNATSGPGSLLKRPVTIYVEAFSCNMEGSAPAWAKLELDQALWDRLRLLQNLVQQHNLKEVSDWSTPSWSWDSPTVSDPEAEGLDVCRAEVCDDRFWYFARTHHSDTQVETQPLVLEALSNALKQGDCEDDRLWRIGEVILYASRENRQTFVETLLEDQEPVEAFESSKN